VMSPRPSAPEASRLAPTCADPRMTLTIGNQGGNCRAAHSRRYAADLSRLARWLGRDKNGLSADWQNVYRALAEAIDPADVPDRGVARYRSSRPPAGSWHPVRMRASPTGWSGSCCHEMSASLAEGP
jgi:hypothetical protein